MNPEEYEKMFTEENTYWWYQGRKEIVLALLGYHTALSSRRLSVLDMGCGTGLMLEALGPLAHPVGVDFSPLALKFCRQREIARLVCAPVESLPFRNEQFDLLLALDLLEHMDDDAALIREMWRLCRPDGHVLITVPAFPFLWSDHDEALHHRRRYTRQSLRRLIRTAEFEIVRFTSTITLMLPPIALFRFVQRFLAPKRRPKSHHIHLPGPLNRLLITLLKCEARWLRRFDFPAGVSLIALLRKPAVRV